MGDALPFTFELEDISGNSHIENPHAPSADPTMVVAAFDRTHDMNVKVRFNSGTVGTFGTFAEWKVFK